MASISLCMIVKDEEAVLERCLEAAARVVDEICDLFLRTFGKNLLPEDPYSAADLAGWGDRPGALLSGVEPADFTGRAGR